MLKPSCNLYLTHVQVTLAAFTLIFLFFTANGNIGQWNLPYFLLFFGVLTQLS